mgnify:CR=1 FL=1
MKLNELIKDFDIFVSNEEQSLLDKIQSPCYTDTLTEREIQVAENLVRKSLLSKLRYKGDTVFVPNEKS